MLGMIFTTFVEMVEDSFSPALADELLDDAGFAHGGAYTAVGYYPYEEIVTLVGLLSEKTQTPVPALVKAFGEYLFHALARNHPKMMAQKTDILTLLESLENDIHREVRKLYTDADLPRFDVLERSDQHIQLKYQSPRKLHTLAEGLITGAAHHFGTPVSIQVEPFDGGAGAHIRVTLMSAGAA